MAFITENGTGVKNANAYGTVAGFQAYFGDRVEDVSSLATTTIEQLLVAATDYIETRWGSKLLGDKRFPQSLTSRSVLTATAAFIDGESVTVGDQTYTFRTTPAMANEVEIGASGFASLFNLAEVIAGSNNDDYAGAEFADVDAEALTIFTSRDGITTTTTAANATFDGTASSGQSRKQQPLSFPRIHLRDRDGQLVEGMPDDLLAATYEYAYRARSGNTLAPDPTVDASGARVTGNRTKVGPIETEVSFAENTTIQITKPYPQADRLIKQYTFSGGTIRI